MDGVARERSRQRIRGRLHRVVLTSPAIGRDVPLRVLLPPDGPAPPDGFPVLWLLHGGDDDHRCWSESGRVEEVVGGEPLVVVMPECGPGGWYANWRCSDGPAGPQRWEDHHVGELRRWLEGAFTVRRDRGGHAVVGLSMGGLGAMSYAARHPDRFGFAAAFSGAVDLLDPHLAPFADAMAELNGGRPGDIWGPTEDESTRRARNPVDLAANLASTVVELRTGDGRPPGGDGGPVDLIEATVHRTSSTLHRRLVELGIPHVWDDYGPGVHDWPHWVDALGRTLPGVLASFSDRRDPPTAVDHTFGDDRTDVWGWTVRRGPDATGLSRLRGEPGSWSVEGTGRHEVSVPVRLAPGSEVQGRVGDHPFLRRVGADGRVRVPLQAEPGAPVRCQLELLPTGPVRGPSSAGGDQAAGEPERSARRTT